MASLTFLDIVVLLFLGGGALLGLMRGFVFEVLSLFAWAAVVTALKLFYAPVTLVIGRYIHTPAGAGLLAFVLVGGLIYLAARAIAARMGARTRASILGPVDRVLGLGFGAIKGLIGVTLLFMVGNLAYDVVFTGTAPRPAWVRTARSYPLLQASRRAVDDFVARRQRGGDTAPANSTDDAGRPI